MRRNRKLGEYGSQRKSSTTQSTWGGRKGGGRGESKVRASTQSAENTSVLLCGGDLRKMRREEEQIPASSLAHQGENAKQKSREEKRELEQGKN